MFSYLHDNTKKVNIQMDRPANGKPKMKTANCIRAGGVVSTRSGDYQALYNVNREW